MDSFTLEQDPMAAWCIRGYEHQGQIKLVMCWIVKYVQGSR
jgi:hypothetical protein